jgi:hypothetical protein
MTERNILDGMVAAVQYRRKDDGIAWITMAAFDVRGAADAYHGLQRNDDVNCPWEYRVVDLPPALGEGRGDAK